ncbi:TetR/AcrR family transcriptional regulator [Paraburkholderia sp. BCC1876]|uniref:TetR/AcrR family transcriptional regulator n=1 Tax=Paraburkholderia sp. BCC1876 TaxID=2676303 RepID=UPI001591B421|nr:TetR/AcrR family transcriptional regulator [Paraburkholderia sp. BCC1876]
MPDKLSVSTQPAEAMPVNFVNSPLSVTSVSCNVRFMNRKDTLRDQALAYFLEHGIADLSLRPLAEQIGTSARLLIFHFGSKDGLIAEVMGEVRQRAQQSFTALMRESGGQGGMKIFWQWSTHANNVPYVRLLYEVQVLAMQNPAVYAPFMDDNSSNWLSFVESTLPPSPQRRATATLYVAVIDGLMLEFLSTGDLARTSAALGVFISMSGNAPGKSRT